MGSRLSGTGRLGHRGRSRCGRSGQLSPMPIRQISVQAPGALPVEVASSRTPPHTGLETDVTMPAPAHPPPLAATSQLALGVGFPAFSAIGRDVVDHSVGEIALRARADDTPGREDEAVDWRPDRR